MRSLRPVCALRVASVRTRSYSHSTRSRVSRVSPLIGVKLQVQGRTRSFSTSKVRCKSGSTLEEITGKTNILLMGPPGSGKTTVGALLSKQLNMPVIDVDNDHLEKVWGDTVANKLNELGDESFLEAEGQATKQLSVENTIISLTGSNPLHAESFAHLRKNGIVVFLDVKHEDILARCEEMKVDRIIGQATNGLDAVLKHRVSVYENSYDIRVLVEKNETPESIAAQVVDKVHKSQRFYSTRDIRPEEEKMKAPPVNFFEVVTKGLADDRGLYFPTYFPKITLGQLERLVDLPYQERALRILELFPLADLPPPQLKKILYEGYSSFTDERVLPLGHIQGNYWQLEEYHGPTASFKDLALQITPRLFQESVKAADRGTEDFLFIVATSGDTGSACLDGFGKNENTPVIVLYPDGGVSKVQQAQMASCQGDVCVISVKGDFDFCQTTVKDIFNSPDIQKEMREEYKVNLTSGNSINWGRLFPQIPYTFSAYLDLVKEGAIKMGDPMDLCVPSGNFGNILGGIVARKMGLPVERLISACNENNILSDFLETGTFDARGRKLVKSPSPSIDILLPSNLERFLYLSSNYDANVINQWFTAHAEKGVFAIPPELHSNIKQSVMAGWCDTPGTYAQIRKTLDETGVLLDPHTAVGQVVAEQFADPNKPNKPMVIAGTAHYSKFPDAVLKGLGVEAGEKEGLETLFGKLREVKTTTKFHPSVDYLTKAKVLHDVVVPGEMDAVMAQIRKFLAQRLTNK